MVKDLQQRHDVNTQRYAMAVVLATYEYIHRNKRRRRRRRKRGDFFFRLLVFTISFSLSLSLFSYFFFFVFQIIKDSNAVCGPFFFLFPEMAGHFNLSLLFSFCFHHSRSWSTTVPTSSSFMHSTRERECVSIHTDAHTESGWWW